jgi:hypothetical protein
MREEALLAKKKMELINSALLITDAKGRNI